MQPCVTSFSSIKLVIEAPHTFNLRSLFSIRIQAARESDKLCPIHTSLNLFLEEADGFLLAQTLLQKLEVNVTGIYSFILYAR